MKDPRHYLLFGRDDYSKGEYLTDLKTRLIPDKNFSLNFQEFNAESDSVPAFFDFLGTAPFLSEKRVAVFQNIESLETDEKERLESGLEALPETAVAILVTSEASTKKSVFLTRLSESLKTVAFYLPFDKDWPAWIAARAQKKSLKLTEGVTALLLERVGKDPAGMSMAIEKLAVYVHPRHEVTLDEARGLLGNSLQEDAFGLLDDLVTKNAEACVRRVRNLLADGARAYEIIGALAMGAERLKKIRECLDRQMNTQQIALELKIPAFFLDQAVRQARAVTMADAKRLLESLLETDEALKTGALDEVRALEYFALEQCLIGR